VCTATEFKDGRPAGTNSIVGFWGLTLQDKEADMGNLNGLLSENLMLSVEQFAKRGNQRTAAYVELARCKSHHFAGKYDVASEYLHNRSTWVTCRLLKPIIQIYRVERWYELLEEALLLGLDCSKNLNDENNAFRFSLELLSDGMSPLDEI
jgi:Foie gras liver health family 1